MKYHNKYNNIRFKQNMLSLNNSIYKITERSLNKNKNRRYYSTNNLSKSNLILSNNVYKNSNGFIKLLNIKNMSINSNKSITSQNLMLMLYSEDKKENIQLKIENDLISQQNHLSFKF